MQVQEIADADDLYRRIHFSQVKDGRPTSAISTSTSTKTAFNPTVVPEVTLASINYNYTFKASNLTNYLKIFGENFDRAGRIQK